MSTIFTSQSTPASARHMHSPRQALKAIARPVVRLVGLLVIIAAWWSWSAGSSSPYFPPLSIVLDAFADNWLFERVVSDVLPSLRHMAIGFTLAALIGVGAGVVLGLSPTLVRATQPMLEFLRAMPPPVFLSFGLLFLGTGSSMKIAVIALGPVWPILLNTIEGVRGADEARTDMAHTFGLPRHAVITRVLFPSALPRIVAGLRVGLPLALILMVISELVGSTEGIGYFVIQSSTTYAIADMWSGILLLGLLGWALSSLMSIAEHALLRGYPEENAR